jgi:hypothetical protein
MVWLTNQGGQFSWDRTGGSVLIWGFVRQPKPDDFLRQVGGRSLAGVDEEIPKHSPTPRFDAG